MGNSKSSYSLNEGYSLPRRHDKKKKSFKIFRNKHKKYNRQKVNSMNNIPDKPNHLVDRHVTSMIENGNYSSLDIDNEGVNKESKKEYQCDTLYDNLYLSPIKKEGSEKPAEASTENNTSCNTSQLDFSESYKSYLCRKNRYINSPRTCRNHFNELNYKKSFSRQFFPNNSHPTQRTLCSQLSTPDSHKRLQYSHCELIVDGFKISQSPKLTESSEKSGRRKKLRTMSGGETSLNSDDLMLTTDVNLDQADDDINKDFISSEKDDPFLILQEEDENTEKEKQADKEIINVDSKEPLVLAQTSNQLNNESSSNTIITDQTDYLAKCVQSTPNNNKNSAQDNLNNNMRKRSPHKLLISKSTSLNQRRPHSLSSPPPLSASSSYQNSSSHNFKHRNQARRRTQLLSQNSTVDDEDSDYLFNSTGAPTTINQDLSSLRLMLLRLGRMMTENEATELNTTCSMFQCNNNNHNILSEPTTPILPSVIPEDCAFERNWAELSKDELLNELKYVQKLNSDLQNKLREKDRIIDLMKSYNYRSRLSIHRTDSTSNCNQNINRSLIFDESPGLQECLIND